MPLSWTKPAADQPSRERSTGISLLLAFWRQLKLPDVLGGRIRRQTRHTRATIEAAIRQTYRLALHRHPSNQEVMSWSDRVALTSEVCNLAAALTSIATAAYTPAERPLPNRSRGTSLLFVFWRSLKLTGVLGGRIRRRTKRIEAAIRQTYRLALHRDPSNREVMSWSGHVAPTSEANDLASAVTAIATAAYSFAESPLPNLSNGEFIQLAHEIICRRGALPAEITFYDNQLEHRSLTRTLLIMLLFRHYADARIERDDNAKANETLLSSLIVPGIRLSSRDWQQRKQQMDRQTRPSNPKVKAYSRFPLISKPGTLVSIITSLYNGGAFISRFMENITSQTIFIDYCELIIVDANSPDNEYNIIKYYLNKFSNIRYMRTPSRIGLYEAWNVAVCEARGQYITNANVDDLRRVDSLELQAAALDNLKFADVVYQDVYYCLDASLGFEQASAVDFVSRLPVVCPNSLVRFNSPHNAPMWRRSLHEEIGLFDSGYTSAGDWEFWIRCAIAGKQFYKLNDPHVMYFVNPAGVSTRTDSLGVAEGDRITLTHGRALISAHLVSQPDRFLQEVGRRSAIWLDSRQINTEDWRYSTVQLALRQIAMNSRQRSREQSRT